MEVPELVKRVSEARYRACDGPRERLKVGDRIRNKTFRGLIGSVVRECDDDDKGQMVVVVYEGEGKETVEPLVAISAIEKCVECDTWKERGGYCSLGHWEVLRGVEDVLLGQYFVGVEPLSRLDRCLGLIITSMIGDTLGAPFEGWGSKKIMHQVGVPSRFVPGTHMGIREAGMRIGMYTDDSNTLLALASALVKSHGTIDAELIAREYASFYFDYQPKRGMPDSAQRVLAQVRAGEDVRTTGIRSFCWGSFANGACMRISPLSLVTAVDCKGTTNGDDELLGLVAECCISSHCHPEAVDAAFVQAKSCAYLLRVGAAEFDPNAFVDAMYTSAKCEAVRTRLAKLKPMLRQSTHTDAEAMEAAGIDYGFQLFAPDAIASAIWFIARYHDSGPEQVLIKTVALGGDCDTTGAMVGAMVGAHWGTQWIPVRWYGLLENGERGRDWAVETARSLATLGGNSKCAPTNTAFMTRPLHSLIDVAMRIIREHAKVPPTFNLGEANGPQILRTGGKTLWAQLWEALAWENSLRYDIAASVTAFFTDTYSEVCKDLVAGRGFISQDQWNALRVKIEAHNKKQ